MCEYRTLGSKNSSLAWSQRTGRSSDDSYGLTCAGPEEGQSSDIREPPTCWRLPDGTQVSAIGLGTRSGWPDQITDRSLEEVILLALQKGLSLFDTGPDFRLGRSERVLGQSLSRAFDEQLVRRDQICVVTKAGKSGSHRLRGFGGRCFDASWIAESINRSRTDLHLTTLDIVLLDGLEWGLAEWGGSWRDKVSAVLETLELQRAVGSIKWYGICSTVGAFCVPGFDLHLPIEALVNLASRVAGSSNGFRFIQVPFNAGRLAAATRMNQPLKAATGSVLLVAMDNELNVLVCCPFDHGHVFHQIRSDTAIKEEGKVFSTAQWMVQFVKSMPGVSCCVLGTTKEDHLKEALAVSSEPLWDVDTLERILSRGTGPR